MRYLIYPIHICGLASLLRPGPSFFNFLKVRRERTRCTDDRAHYEREADQIRRIANERAEAEIDRIKEEEANKRKILAKKHAVIFIMNMGQVSGCLDFLY